jgi:hypothetical protein
MIFYDTSTSICMIHLLAKGESLIDLYVIWCGRIELTITRLRMRYPSNACCERVYMVQHPYPNDIMI